MKIGINGAILCTPEPGGVARVAIEISKQLAKKSDQTLIFSHDLSKERLDGIPVDSFGYLSQSRSFGLLWEQLVLPIKSRQKDIDVLYSPTPYVPLPPTPCPCVITIHDVSSLQEYSAGWYNEYEKISLPILSDRADVVLTISEFSKSEIHSKLNIPEQDIRVVPNGVSDHFFSNDSEGASISLPDKYILYVGSVGKRKNVSGLIESFRYLKSNRNIPHKLVLIGPEDDSTNTSGIVSDNFESAENSIIRFGYLPKTKLKKAYTAADLFVFPSLYEGFGIPPLEAMACETPVVASDQTAIPEVLGSAAKYVDPYDTEDMAEGIYEVLTNEELEKTLIQRGRERAEQFRWENSADQLMEILTDIV